MKETVFIKIGENGAAFCISNGESLPRGGALRRKLVNSAGAVIEIEKDKIRFLSSHCYKIVAPPKPKKVEIEESISKPKREKKLEHKKQDSSTAAIPKIGQLGKGD